MMILVKLQNSYLITVEIAIVESSINPTECKIVLADGSDRAAIAYFY